MSMIRSGFSGQAGADDASVPLDGSEAADGMEVQCVDRYALGEGRRGLGRQGRLAQAAKSGT